MIFITGDMHGIRERLYNPFLQSLNPDDILIVTGDFGFVFDNDIIESEELFLDSIADYCHFTIGFIDGNHECFPRLNHFPVEEHFGGRVKRVRHNVLWLRRGQVYDLPGDERNLKVFCMGGGYSIDKALREKYWWPEEMPCSEEYEQAEYNLNYCKRKVDAIITHTAPLDTVYRMGIQHDLHEDPLNNYLQYVSETVAYDRWFFGHFHRDEYVWKNQHCIYKEIRELITGVTVWTP